MTEEDAIISMRWLALDAEACRDAVLSIGILNRPAFKSGLTMQFKRFVMVCYDYFEESSIRVLVPPTPREKLSPLCAPGDIPIEPRIEVQSVSVDGTPHTVKMRHPDTGRCLQIFNNGPDTVRVKIWNSRHETAIAKNTMCRFDFPVSEVELSCLDGESASVSVLEFYAI